MSESERARMSPKLPKEMDIEEIADRLAGAQPGSLQHGQMVSELSRRQTVAQLEAAEAQKIAADAEREAAIAAIATARSTEKNAKYMLWSVLAAAASAVITAASVAFSIFSHHSN